MKPIEQLLHAVVNNRLEEVQRLIQTRIVVPQDVERERGNHPLHYAAHNDNLPIVECLIKAGAPLNVKSPLGWTPLHIAAVRGYISVVKLLVNAGADYLAVTNDGRTAKQLAQDEYVITFLQQCEDTPDVKEPDCN